MSLLHLRFSIPGVVVLILPEEWSSTLRRTASRWTYRRMLLQICLSSQLIVRISIMLQQGLHGREQLQICSRNRKKRLPSTLQHHMPSQVEQHKSRKPSFGLTWEWKIEFQICDHHQYQVYPWIMLLQLRRMSWIQLQISMALKRLLVFWKRMSNRQISKTAWIKCQLSCEVCWPTNLEMLFNCRQRVFQEVYFGQICHQNTCLNVEKKRQLNNHCTYC